MNVCCVAAGGTPRGTGGGTPRGRGRPRKEDGDKAVKAGRKPGRPRKRASPESSPVESPDSDETPEPKKSKSMPGEEKSNQLNLLKQNNQAFRGRATLGLEAV